MKNIIVLIILTIIFAIITTAIFIINHKIDCINDTALEENVDEANNIVAEKPQDASKLYKKYHQNIEDGITGVSPDDEFYKNALIWRKKFYEDDKYAGYYYQIEGLKDKKVQKTVNEKLLNSALDYCKKMEKSVKEDEFNEYDSYYGFAFYKDKELYIYYPKKGFALLNEYDMYVDDESAIISKESSGFKIFFDQEIVASFSNVICVATADYSDYRKGYFGNTYYENRTYDEYLNVDLNTGDDIQIEDLFASNTNIKVILAHMLYAEKAKIEVPWTEYYWDDELEVEVEYSSDDQIDGPDLAELEKIIRKIDYTKDIKFGFTASQFFIHLDDCFCVKDFETISYTREDSDIYNEMAIFKRFLSKSSLYEDDSLAVKFKVKEADEYQNVIKRVDGKETLSNVDYINKLYGKETILYYNCSNKLDDYEAGILLDNFVSEKGIHSHTDTINVFLCDVTVGMRYSYRENVIKDFNNIFNNGELYFIRTSYGNNDYYVKYENNKFIEIENIMEYIFRNYATLDIEKLTNELWTYYKEEHPHLFDKNPDQKYKRYSITDTSLTIYYDTDKYSNNIREEDVKFNFVDIDEHFNYRCYPILGYMSFT